ncbi:nicotinamide riboside transporter PnuC [Spiroplasma cantharicola]|uniref:Nicotinamide mononucleotide transporter n=1 Tax=Spiroplasma cantharicola TaxID=362837 RepID=A0A0M4KEQ4_9MOLU|nr:nicotinamide riboside transporter PnuC [Spiroplasma cantharicola]ALD66520.1 nicotinamide mononucleotide transporter [Spiroplasma cantharicola]
MKTTNNENLDHEENQSIQNKEIKKQNIFLKFLKSELSGWNAFEILLLVISTALILTLGIIAKDKAISILAGITGTIAVILGAKGKISAFIVGATNSVLYIILLLQGSLFSSIILHAAFYIPMNIIGFGLWFRKRDNKGDVMSRFLSWPAMIVIYVSLIVVWIAYSFLLIEFTDAKSVWLDSFILIGSAMAIILMIFRYVDQWTLWLLTNLMCLIMWSVILADIENSSFERSTVIIFIIQWGSSLINSFYGFWNWIRLNKNSKKYEIKVLSKEDYDKLSKSKKIAYNLDKFFTKK